MAGKRKSASAPKAPISSHPFFPIVVAVWFAALLGLGSLILPVVLFERFFAATGIASVVPSTQAPLGLTARLLIGTTAGLTGAIAGLLVARKVAAANETAPERKRGVAKADAKADAKPVKKPISALDELGSEGLDEPIDAAPQTPARAKRRGLTVTDESGPSDFLELAPLPGGEAAYQASAVPLDDPLELTLAAEDDAHDSNFAPAAHQEAEGLSQPFGENAAAIDFAAVDEIDEYRPAATAPTPPANPADDLRKELDSMSNDTTPPQNQSYNPLGHSHVADGQQFARPFGATAPKAQEPQVRFTQPAAQPAMATASHEPAPFALPQGVEPSIPAEPVRQAFQVPHAAPAPAAHSQSARPLHELGMAELVERFAKALQSSGETPQPQFAPAAANPAPVAAQVHPEPAPSHEPAPQPVQAQADTAAPFVFRRTAAASEESPVFEQPVEPVQQTAQVPTALRPLGVDEDYAEDDEDLGTLALSLSAMRAQQTSAGEGFAEPAAEPVQHFDTAQASATAPEPQAYTPPFAAVTNVETDEAEDEDTGENESYSSLLSMRNPIGDSREFVRIEDDEPVAGGAEPVVVFPGQDERGAEPVIDRPFQAPAPSASEHQVARPFDGPSVKPAGKPADAGATEQALREALEKLQRMSGAA